MVIAIGRPHLSRLQTTTHSILLAIANSVSLQQQQQPQTGKRLFLATGNRLFVRPLFLLFPFSSLASPLDFPIRFVFAYQWAIIFFQLSKKVKKAKHKSKAIAQVWWPGRLLSLLLMTSGHRWALLFSTTSGLPFLPVSSVSFLLQSFRFFNWFPLIIATSFKELYTGNGSTAASSNLRGIFNLCSRTQCTSRFLSIAFCFAPFRWSLLLPRQSCSPPLDGPKHTSPRRRRRQQQQTQTLHSSLFVGHVCVCAAAVVVVVVIVAAAAALAFTFACAIAIITANVAARTQLSVDPFGSDLEIAI